MSVITIRRLGLRPELQRKLLECGIDTIGKLIRHNPRSLRDYGITQFEVELIEQALNKSHLELNMGNRGRR